MWRRTWATVAVSILALVAVGGGTVAASTNTLPGHPLYAVKTTVERAQLALTTSDVGKAKLLAKFADKRVKEIGSMVGAGRGDEVDELSVAMARDLERIKDTINEPRSPDRAISDANKAVTAAAPAQTASPVPAPSSGVGPAALGARPEQKPRTGKSKDRGISARPGTLLRCGKASVQKHLETTSRYLEELLKKAPEKDRPAIPPGD